MQIDEALRTAAEEGKVAGVVAVAATDREILYEGAFGRRALPDGAPMTLDTVFWIASMTKAVTCAAAMQLVEQGKLGLEDEMRNVLPELAAPQVLEGFEASGAPRLRPAKRPITLRHLMTHTAGFSYNIWNREIGRYMEQTGCPGITTCENAALRLPLVFDPGEAWDYGIGIDFVGKAVEAASGQDLEQYFRDQLLGPLGMKDTSFLLTPDTRARLAGMHARLPDGTLQPIPFALPEAPEFFMGGGGLYGTAPDYLRFVRMLLNGGALDGVRLLRPETVALMAQSHIGDVDVVTLRTAHPELSNDADFFPGMKQKWGLSFVINTKPGPHGRSAGSLAWAGLGNTYFWLDPESRVGGVLLTQSLPFADPVALGLFGALERGAYAALGEGTRRAA